MCYNYSYQERKQRRLEERYGVKPAPNLKELVPPAIYTSNGFSHNYMPIITAEHPEQIQPLKWGFIPNWVGADPVKIIQGWNSTLNCRSESMFEKPTFKKASQAGKRCLILADGFYEWHTIGKNKYPFYFQMKDQEMFCFAGIYDECTNKATGERFIGYSMLTCVASPLLAKIHNAREEEDFRMPVILPDKNVRHWLNPDLTQQDVLDLCQPFNDAELQTHSISKLITSRKENPNVELVQAPFEYPELKDLFS